jgi:hypothetical protein
LVLIFKLFPFSLISSSVLFFLTSLLWCFIWILSSLVQISFDLFFLSSCFLCQDWIKGRNGFIRKSEIWLRMNWSAVPIATLYMGFIPIITILLSSSMLFFDFHILFLRYHGSWSYFYPLHIFTFLVWILIILTGFYSPFYQTFLYLFGFISDFFCSSLQ